MGVHILAAGLLRGTAGVARLWQEMACLSWVVVIKWEKKIRDRSGKKEGRRERKGVSRKSAKREKWPYWLGSKFETNLKKKIILLLVKHGLST